MPFVHAVYFISNNGERNSHSVIAIAHVDFLLTEVFNLIS